MRCAFAVEIRQKQNAPRPAIAPLGSLQKTLNVAALQDPFSQVSGLAPLSNAAT